jgi:hypothetical protein
MVPSQSFTLILISILGSRRYLVVRRRSRLLSTTELTSIGLVKKGKPHPFQTPIIFPPPDVSQSLLSNDSNIHAGIRTTLSGPSDYENDGYCGFTRVEAREIDTLGTWGIINKIKSRVGTKNPVYLSIDIDTLDPAFAPATGTPETGGWSTRELRTIIRGLEGINFVAADIVEVAPAYDTNAELTTMAAADTLYEVMTLMVKRGPLTVNATEEWERKNGEMKVVGEGEERRWVMDREKDEMSA